MTKKFMITSLMLLMICSVKGDQQEGSLYEYFHLLVEDQKNLFDQRFQNELEESLFKLQRMSSIQRKIRNISALYTAVPTCVLLMVAALRLGGCLESRHLSYAVGGMINLSLLPLLFTIPAGLFAAFSKWLTDEQIEHFEQKLVEHRWKMAYLGKCFTDEQIERFEQKLKELRLQVEMSKENCGFLSALL